MQNTPARRTGPIRLAVLNDYELVVRGVAAMLEPFADRVVVVELDSELPVAQSVDIGLYDTYSMPADADERIDWVTRDAKVEHGVLYTWVVTQGVVDAARRDGLAAVLSKSLPADALVTALERICAGETVTHPYTEVEDGSHDGGWPGKTEGLTPRQSEVIALVTEGLSNQEIARRTYLSINSVKSYIRAAYRTMGVSSRSQAVLWGIDHGFHRERRRLVPQQDGGRTFLVDAAGRSS